MFRRFTFDGFLKRLVKRCFRKKICAECVQVGSGFEFTNRFSNSKRDILTLFEKTAAKLGIPHKRIRFNMPRHKGEVERSHREFQKRFCGTPASPVLGSVCHLIQGDEPTEKRREISGTLISSTLSLSLGPTHHLRASPFRRKYALQIEC